eukprot:3290992-Rhodomonas_salina.1
MACGFYQGKHSMTRELRSQGAPSTRLVPVIGVDSVSDRYHDLDSESPAETELLSGYPSQLEPGIGKLPDH